MFNFLSPNKNIFSYDTFYLTYDEPEKQLRQEELKKLIPEIIFVDGIKGFDRAHKKCAELSKTNRLVIIDGDNSFVSKRETSLLISKKLLKTDYVLSYSSKNSINGLIYGNGGIKCWPRDVLINTHSHESSTDQESSVDFCFSTKYYQIPETPTLSNINITPFQAFRAGYREGVKMTLNKGIPLKEFECLENAIYPSNLFRLKTWCEIGRDVSNGIWAIYGARLGLLEILEDISLLDKIRDYDWFMNKWKSIEKSSPENEAREVADKISRHFNFLIDELDVNESIEFKKTIKNPHREGLMFPDME